MSQRITASAPAPRWAAGCIRLAGNGVVNRPEMLTSPEDQRPGTGFWDSRRITVARFILSGRRVGNRELRSGVGLRPFLELSFQRPSELQVTPAHGRPQHAPHGLQVAQT